MVESSNIYVNGRAHYALVFLERRLCSAQRNTKKICYELKRSIGTSGSASQPVPTLVRVRQLTTLQPLKPPIPGFFDAPTRDDRAFTEIVAIVSKFVAGFRNWLRCLGPDLATFLQEPGGAWTGFVLNKSPSDNFPFS